MTQLKPNSSSFDKAGTYRWFQSQHAQVNDLIETFQRVSKITLAKLSQRELVQEIETKLQLAPTPSEIS